MNIIGIDPGINTGYCLIRNGIIEYIITTDFWGCIAELQLIEDIDNTLIVIELPSSKHVWHNGATNKAAIQRTGFNVGGVYMRAELVVEWLMINDYNYVTCNPLGKIKSDEFKAVTGWSGVTNQHERDAAMMAWKYRNYRVK